MAYVYKHIRLDSEEIFYIGIATRKDRATSKSKRKKHWNNIVNLHGYRVEYIKKGITLDEAKALEIQLIAEYGRESNGGILTNITPGGDGRFGIPTIHSDETKHKIRTTMKAHHQNNSFTKEQRKKMSDAAILQRSTSTTAGNFNPHSEDSKIRMSLARKEWWRLKKLSVKE